MTIPEYYPIELFHYVGINDLLKVKYILQKYPYYLNSLNSCYDNILLVAIRTHSNKIVKFLIESTDIDLNYSYQSINNEGNAFSVAVAQKNKYALSLLLKTDINKNELSLSGLPPFLYSIEKGDLLAVKFLLKNKNFDTDQYLKNNKALSLAIENKKFHLAFYLSKHYFPIDLTNLKNKPLLINVVESFNISLINELIKNKKFSKFLLTQDERYRLLYLSCDVNFSLSFFKKLWLSTSFQNKSISHLQQLFLENAYLFLDDDNVKKIKFLFQYLDSQQQDILKKDILNHLNSLNIDRPQMLFYLSDKENLLNQLSNDLTAKENMPYKQKKL